ncbi:hypothetical protein [Lacinutrix chionoecetis]
MENQFNFIIESELPYSKLSKSKGLLDFKSLCNYIKQLPYGRTKNRSAIASVLIEHTGTCSSKHAFLKQVAIENNQNEVQLFIGIYKMNEANTKGVGVVLKTKHLRYIPEAHTYLKINGLIADVTREMTSLKSFKNALLFEEEILPYQVIDYKVNLHKQYLKQWITDTKITENFLQIWTIRELCIASLSK